MFGFRVHLINSHKTHTQHLKWHNKDVLNCLIRVFEEGMCSLCYINNFYRPILCVVKEWKLNFFYKKKKAGIMHSMWNYPQNKMLIAFWANLDGFDVTIMKKYYLYIHWKFKYFWVKEENRHRIETFIGRTTDSILSYTFPNKYITKMSITKLIQF